MALDVVKNSPRRADDEDRAAFEARNLLFHIHAAHKDGRLKAFDFAEKLRFAGVLHGQFTSRRENENPRRLFALRKGPRQRKNKGQRLS